MNLPATATRVLKFLQGRATNGIVNVRQRDIIEGAKVSSGSMQLALRRLEALGVVMTERNPSDKREVTYRLFEIGG